MKKFLWIILAVLLVFTAALAGCGSKPTVTNPKASAQGGFYTPDQVYKGGQPFSEKGKVNVKEMSITKQGSDTVIEMKFLYGSKDAGVNEQRVNHVPEYEVSTLPLPERLVVKVGDIDFYDYAEKDYTFDGQVKGIMDAMREDSYTMYFALSGAADYKVEETAESIKITLRSAEAPKAQGYFATLNAYSDFQNPGDASVYDGFTPTLCSDGTSRILISKMFASQADAEKFRDEAQTKLENVVISVVQLATGELPEVVEGDIGAMKVVKKGSAAYPLPLLVNDGIYLCESPEGQVLFARNTDAEEAATDDGEDNGEDGEIDENPMIQKLMLVDAKGTEQPVADSSEFSNITKALYSSDGKYIAILDNDNDNRILYVCNTETNEVLNMGEEGLGTLTDDFVWNSEKDVLYSISGNFTDEGEENKQLMMTDFTKSDYKPAALEEQSIASGKMGFAGGKVYFSDDTDNGLEIYTYDPVTDTRTKLADGADFTLSPDGKYMEYLVASASSGSSDSEDQYFDIMLLNLSTSEKKVLAEKATVPEEGSYCGFTADSSKFYYINNTPEDTPGLDNTFDQQVYCYDMASGTSKLEFLTTSESFVVPKESGKLYLNVVYSTDDNNGLYVTYVYDANKDYAAK
jgi:hypothetical protein